MKLTVKQLKQLIKEEVMSNLQTYSGHPKEQEVLMNIVELLSEVEGLVQGLPGKKHGYDTLIKIKDQLQSVKWWAEQVK